MPSVRAAMRLSALPLFHVELVVFKNRAAPCDTVPVRMNPYKPAARRGIAPALAARAV